MVDRDINLVGIADMGKLTEPRKLRFNIHEFESLPQRRNEFIETPSLMCHGYEWRLKLYPRGRGDGQFVSVFLRCVDIDGPKVTKFTLSIPSSAKPEFTARIANIIISGWSEYARRDYILNPTKNCLVEGTLTIEVDIAVALESDSLRKYNPENTLSKDMLKMLEKANNEETADVVFQIGLDLVYAHSPILAARAPALAALVGDYDKKTPIPINDVDPAVFRMLLRHIYGGEIPNDDVLRENARTLIDAANKYGCSDMKLVAESEVASMAITTQNCADLILYADAKNCALLKEAAIDFFVANADEVMESDGFAMVKESSKIMGELMLTGLGKKEPSLRVGTLRRKLKERGLELDGSKEMLIKRLESKV